MKSVDKRCFGVCLVSPVIQSMSFVMNAYSELIVLYCQIVLCTSFCNLSGGVAPFAYDSLFCSLSVPLDSIHLSWAFVLVGSLKEAA